MRLVAAAFRRYSHPKVAWAVFEVSERLFPVYVF